MPPWITYEELYLAERSENRNMYRKNINVFVNYACLTSYLQQHLIISQTLRLKFP